MSPLPFLLAPFLCLPALTSFTAPSEGDSSLNNARPAGEEKNAKKKQPACISFKTQARYISGFNHLVIIKNDCEKVARCSVSTDVNPKEKNVRVQPKSSETVLTYRGSPAREFTAQVNCELEGTKSSR